MPTARDFDISNPINVVRLMAGLFYIPHVLFKVTGFSGSLIAFQKMGFDPPLAWVTLAIFTGGALCGWPDVQSLHPVRRIDCPPAR